LVRDKLKKYREKTACGYCNKLCNNKEELNVHLINIHGRYPLDEHINNNLGDITLKRLFLEAIGEKPRLKLISIEKKEILYTRPIIEENEIEDLWVHDYTHINKGYMITCKSCLTNILTTHKPEFDNHLNCPFCGLNLFVDGRKSIYNWIHKGEKKKLPKSIRIDVVDTAKPIEEEIKTLRIPIINMKGGKSNGNAMPKM